MSSVVVRVVSGPRRGLFLVLCRRATKRAAEPATDPATALDTASWFSAAAPSSHRSSQSLKKPWSQGQSHAPGRRCCHCRDLALPSLSVLWALLLIFLGTRGTSCPSSGGYARFDDHSCSSVLSKAQITRVRVGSGERSIPPGRMPQGRLVPDRLSRHGRRQPGASAPRTPTLRGLGRRGVPVVGGVSSAGAGCGCHLRDPVSSWAQTPCGGTGTLARRTAD